MKALILSFFAVILGYSLIFDEKGAADRQPAVKDSSSVYVNKPVDTQIPDSTGIYRDKIVCIL